MIRAHGWSSAAPARRSSGLGRGCATLAMIVLIIYGLSTLYGVVVPPSPSIRENAWFYIAIALVQLTAAATIWRLWLRPAGPSSDVRVPHVQEPASHDVVKHGLKYLEDSLLPSQVSTDLLPWAWLIRLDLAFRDHLWVRIGTLLASILVLFLVVPLLLALLYDAGVFR